jgi:two-component system, response regulator PdtaR
MHALIIEDNSIIAMLVEDELRELGFTSFDRAFTQTEAIAAATKQCPDLIIADDRLATGSGVEAVRIICATVSIPTVYTVGNDIELRRALPDTIIIGKPFGGAELRTAVERASPMIILSPQ